MSNEDYKTCDICKDKTNCNFDELLFGDWQHSRGITVHYYCLLLSTNLPQKGKDFSGINGFLLRDIRREINAASKRTCCYCARSNASIQCFKCHDYFHLCCGRANRCLFTFTGDFRSYCDDCVPRQDLRPAELKKRPSSFERCSICRDQMGLYDEVIFVFGKCCNKGYAHNVCVQKYALAAGYYLRCLWCRSKDFRDTVPLHGVFVPDRDACWEMQKGTYTDLHRGHSTCDMDICFCPKGRDYNSGKWTVILCSLCGSVGAHNPKCLLGNENAKERVTTFKCVTCARTESRVSNFPGNESTADNADDLITKSIYMRKKNNNAEEKSAASFIATFSEDEDSQLSSESFITVIPQKRSDMNSSIRTCSAEKNPSVEVIVASGATSKENISPESSCKSSVANAETVVISESEDSSEDTSTCPNENIANLSSSKAQEPTLCKNNEETQVLKLNENVAHLAASKAQEPILHMDDEETQLFELNENIANLAASRAQEPMLFRNDETQIVEPNENISSLATSKAQEPMLFRNDETQAVEPNENISILATSKAQEPMLFRNDETQVFEPNEIISILATSKAQEPMLFRNDETQEVEPNENILILATSKSQEPALYMNDEETQLFEPNSSCMSKERTQPRASLTQEPIIPYTQEERTKDLDNIHRVEKPQTQLVVDENITEASSTTMEQYVGPTKELTCAQIANSPDDINQSPVVSSSSQVEEEWASFEVYEYDEAEGKCVGSATVRINLFDERFAGMSLREIEINSAKLLSAGDVVERSDGIGFFAKIDEIIGEYTN